MIQYTILPYVFISISFGLFLILSELLLRHLIMPLNKLYWSSLSFCDPSQKVSFCLLSTSWAIESLLSLEWLLHTSKFQNPWILSCPARSHNSFNTVLIFAFPLTFSRVFVFSLLRHWFTFPYPLLPVLSIPLLLSSINFNYSSFFPFFFLTYLLMIGKILQFTLEGTYF